MTIVDTGVLYAAMDSDDPSHEPSAAFIESAETIVVPAPVVVELDWLAYSRKTPALSATLDAIVAGAIEIEPLVRDDYVRIRELCARYADLPLGLVDASVVAVAERLEQDTIATLDHRHFSVVRPRHVSAFTLVP